jgi:hypothetical protein
MAPLRLNTLRFGKMSAQKRHKNCVKSANGHARNRRGHWAFHVQNPPQSREDVMRNILRFGVVISALLFVGANAQAQQWCTFNPVRDAQFNCGYSTELACENATKAAHGACTLDPFYD